MRWRACFFPRARDKARSPTNDPIYHMVPGTPRGRREILAKTITVIPGDGIGPEVTAATLTVLDAVGADLLYEEHLAGITAVQEMDDPMPAATLESVRKNGVLLKGPLGTLSGPASALSTWRSEKSLICTPMCDRRVPSFPAVVTRTSIWC